MAPSIEDKKSSDEEELKLKIDAHVVRQLGEELISDPEQAILELVKNAYDADSDWCKLSIDTKCVESINGDQFIGKITIRDNGIGMGRADINSGWLTISHSDKREKKAKKEKTKKHGRTYTGDKGLGRLGSMKLATVIRITTWQEDRKNGICVEFNWDDFLAGKTLDQVSVNEITLEPQKNTGSKIELIGIRDPSYWKGEDNLNKLTARLSTLLSPFGHLKEFKLHATVDKKNLSFSNFSEQLKDASIAKFEFKLKGGKLFSKGFVKLNYFRGNTTEQKELYRKYIKSDSGVGLYKTLCETRNLNEYEIKHNTSDFYHLSFSRESDWEDLPAEVGEQIYPGDFESEIFYYFLKQSEGFHFEGVDTVNEAKQLFEELNGISIYRDGFKVGTGRESDWLHLSDDKTSGEGFYSIRPKNTIGYFDLTHDENPNLKEKSDRQGFVENTAFNGFWTITREMLGFINHFLNRSRRANTKFAEKMQNIEQGRPEIYTAEQAATDLGAMVSSSVSKKTKIQKQSKQVKSAILSAQKNINETLENLLLDPKSRDEIENLKKEINEVEKTVVDYSSSYEKFITTLSNHKAVADKILERMDNLKSQITDFHDHVAIGLSAQAVAHDVNEQIDNINIHSNNLKNRFKELSLNDRDIFASVNAIGADASVIAKNISLLNPMLRNQRLTLEDFDISDVVSSYIELRQDRFEKDDIKVIFDNKYNPAVHYNRGKLTQILDNLVRNSSYWLNHYASHKEFVKEIHIEMTEVGFVFWDTGKGVRNGIEDIIFEMFITDKPDGHGQGLGLFIIKSLLEQVKCSITLLSERNEFDRRYKFEVDFERVIKNGR